MGYRGFDEDDRAPRFPFGHGLGYASLEWRGARVDREVLAAAGSDPGRDRTAVVVTVELHNPATTAAHEVVQCYVHDGTATRRRPDQELRAFAKVTLAPGASGTVELRLSERDLAAWDPDLSGWVVAPGSYELRLGASSRDVRELLDVTVVPREEVTSSELVEEPVQQAEG